MTGKIWVCKVGEDTPKGSGPDAPMRKAIAKAYEEVTGVPPAFIFSGWGGKLTECERAVVENRDPVEPFDEDEHNNENDRLRARVAELVEACNIRTDELHRIAGLLGVKPDADAINAALAKREAVAVPECFLALYRAALGLTHGEDWNNGTAASFHRIPLIDATGRCAELLAASQQAAKGEGT